MRLFVGNLSFSVTDEELRKLFHSNGFPPNDLRVMTDRETGKSRGFAFVSFSNEKQANDALATLNGIMLGGRDLRISVAQDRPQQNNRPAPNRQQNSRQENVIRPTPARPTAAPQPQQAAKPNYENKPVRSERKQYTAAPESYDEWGSCKGGDRRRRDFNGKKRRNRNDYDDDDDWR